MSMVARFKSVILSAGGFGRMTQAVASAPPAQSAPLDAAAAAARRDRLAVWQRGITTAYLVSLIGAFVAAGAIACGSALRARYLGHAMLLTAAIFVCLLPWAILAYLLLFPLLKG